MWEITSSRRWRARCRGNSTDTVSDDAREWYLYESIRTEGDESHLSLLACLSHTFEPLQL